MPAFFRLALTTMTATATATAKSLLPNFPHSPLARITRRRRHKFNEISMYLVPNCFRRSFKMVVCLFTTNQLTMKKFNIPSDEDAIMSVFVINDKMPVTMRTGIPSMSLKLSKTIDQTPATVDSNQLHTWLSSIKYIAGNFNQCLRF